MQGSPASSSLRKPVGAAHGECGSPWHDGDGGGGVLGAALDQLVAVDDIDEDVALGVATADDAHALEQERPALAEGLAALLELALERDGADLAAGERDVGQLLGKAEPACPAALLRHCKMAGDAFDLGIVDGIGRELVVGRQELPDGRFAKDEIRLVGSRGRPTGRDGRRCRQASGNDEILHGARHPPHVLCCGSRTTPACREMFPGPRQRSLRIKARACPSIGATRMPPMIGVE